MIYKGNFTDKGNNIYSVELITVTGESEKKILLSNSPVTISYEGSDDIFKPLKLSGATVRCWVNEYMFDLFTGEAKGVRCVISKGDNLFRCGYNFDDVSFLWSNVNSAPNKTFTKDKLIISKTFASNATDTNSRIMTPFNFEAGKTYSFMIKYKNTSSNAKLNILKPFSYYGIEFNL